MPDLYVANCTRQTHVVCFRLDFNKEGVRHSFKPADKRTVPPGQQIRVAKDEHIDTITAIEEQLRVYGMAAVEELSRARDNTFIPLVFNAAGPVKAKTIKDVMDHNHRVRFLEGADRRRKAAVASNDLVTSTVQRELEAQQLPAGQMPNMDSFSVDYEQQDTTEENQVRLEEGVKVDAAGATSVDAPRERRKPGPKPGSRRKA